MELTLSKQMTLAQVPETAKALKDQIISGEVNPIQADYFLKCIEELAKNIRKDAQVKEIIFNEAEKWEGETYNGNVVKIKERRTPQFNDETLKELKQKVKEREALLKSITNDSNVIDESTGEQLQPIEYKLTRFIEWK